MKTSLYGYKLTIMEVDTVHDDDSVSERYEFFQQHHEEIAKISQSRQLILLTGINSRVGSQDSRKCQGNTEKIL